MYHKVNWNDRIKVGNRFGRLTITGLPEKPMRKTKVICHCDCGTEIPVQLDNLLSGHTKSCGCQRKEASMVHGDYGNEFQKVAKYFFNMYHRANNDYYKSRGRCICEDWAYTNIGYINFKSWLLSELDRLDITLDEFNNLPKHKGLSVDRINNDLGYCPDNCRLATPKQQQRNKSNSKIHEGHHILDWADALAIPYDLIYQIYPDSRQIDVLLWLYSGCPCEWNGPVFPTSRVI